MGLSLLVCNGRRQGRPGSGGYSRPPNLKKKGSYSRLNFLAPFFKMKEISLFWRPWFLFRQMGGGVWAPGISKIQKSNGRGHMESSIRFLCNSPPSSARSCYVQGNPKGEESIASSLTSSSSSSFDGKENGNLGEMCCCCLSCQKSCTNFGPRRNKI
jgi:hypothetical protein